jgi:VanZ family protein
LDALDRLAAGFVGAGAGSLIHHLPGRDDGVNDRSMMQFERPLRALGWYLAACALLTLGPLPRAPLDLLVWMAQGWFHLAGGSGSHPSQPQVEAFANVLLFIPIGFLVGRAYPRCPRYWLFAVLAGGSVLIEVAQLTVVTGRYSNVRDVALNSLGAAIGLAAAGRRSIDVPAQASP